ncbi:MAG: hypothetical protein ACTS2F_23910 [Thainema sp.]
MLGITLQRIQVYQEAKEERRENEARSQIFQSVKSAIALYVLENI